MILPLWFDFTEQTDLMEDRPGGGGPSFDYCLVLLTLNYLPNCLDTTLYQFLFNKFSYIITYIFAVASVAVSWRGPLG